jgi:predicted GNAT family N-acyltransferase
MESPEIQLDVEPRALRHIAPGRLGNLRVEVARDFASLRRAFVVLHRAYAGRGLVEDEAQARVTPHHLLQESIVLVVRHEDRIVGTATVTRDSPARLPLDRDFGAELDALRGRGATLAEIGSLGVEADARGTAVQAALSLSTMWIAERVMGASHIVIGVHPRVVNYYRDTYGFAPLGSEKIHSELNAREIALVHDVRADAHVIERSCKRVGGPTLAQSFTRGILPWLDVPAEVRPRDPASWSLSDRDFASVAALRGSAPLEPAVVEHLRRQRRLATIM